MITTPEQVITTLTQGGILLSDIKYVISTQSMNDFPEEFLIITSVYIKTFDFTLFTSDMVSFRYTCVKMLSFNFIPKQFSNCRNGQNIGFHPTDFAKYDTATPLHLRPAPTTVPLNTRNQHPDKLEAEMKSIQQKQDLILEKQDLILERLANLLPPTTFSSSPARKKSSTHLTGPLVHTQT